MKALVYQGMNEIRWEEKTKPSVNEPTDAVVKILKTTICGTDLHILKGGVPSVAQGRILGHEGVGIIEKVGSAVSSFKADDHVLISCITACGKCVNCRKQMYSHCQSGGWILGNTIDGTQAEYVRIPFADTSLYLIPEGTDEEVIVMLSDILPTGLECGVLNGQVKPGDFIAIVGAGPIGLATLLTARLFSPSKIIMIDIDDNRLSISKDLGATHVINSNDKNVLEKVMHITNAQGVDVAVEAVGIPTTFELCQAIVAVGGHIANIGVHEKPVILHLESLWAKNITITTRLVDTSSTTMLFKIIQSETFHIKKLITHHFKLDEIMNAYETFKNAAEEKALKIILTS